MDGWMDGWMDVTYFFVSVVFICLVLYFKKIVLSNFFI